jgi:hypothetical protein
MYQQERGQLIIECLMFLFVWAMMMTGLFAFGNWLIGG